LSNCNVSDVLSYFRSSTDETSASLHDHERFELPPHNSALEQTVDSQEKMAGDAALGDDLPKPPPPPKKKRTEPELVLVSSSSEPSGPTRHVSLEKPGLVILMIAYQ
jgi:hypothetical protein